MTGHPDAKVEITYLEGGGYVAEVICYAKMKGSAMYKPPPVDLGYLHLSINVENIEGVRCEITRFGLLEIGEKLQPMQAPSKVAIVSSWQNPRES